MPPQVLISERPKRRWNRILLCLAAGLLLIAAVGFFGLPWWLGTKGGRDWLLAQADKKLAPARLEVDSFQWSWFGPTRMRGFVIRDHEGEPVVSAPVAVWDRNLWQAIRDSPRYGTLHLQQPNLQIEVDRNGNVDLVEALAPILDSNPKTQLALTIEAGTLSLDSPVLGQPILGKDLTLTLDRPSDPAPVTWRLGFTQASAEGNPGRFDCEGRVAKDTPDVVARKLELTLRTQRWPIEANLADTGARASGLLETETAVSRQNGRWRSAGKATASGLLVSGGPVQGNPPRFESAKASWDLAQTAEGWNLRTLDFATDGVNIKADANLANKAASGAHLEGTLDLATLSEKFRGALALHPDLKIERGTARVDVTSKPDADVQNATNWHVDARIADLVAERGGATISLEAPARIGADVRVEPANVEVAKFEIASDFMSATGHGDVAIGIDLAGTIDLDAFTKQFGTLVDLASQPQGHGTFSAHYQRSSDAAFTGDLTLDLEQVQVDALPLGLTLPPTFQVKSTITGPADSSGWPLGWTQLSAQLASEEGHATLEARQDEAGLNAVELEAAPRLAFADKPWTVLARLKAQRNGSSWLIPEARLDLAPKGSDFGWPKPRAVTLALSGEYNHESDTLVLRQSDAEIDSPVLRLAPTGVRVAGLRGEHWSAEGGLIVDAAEWDRFASAAGLHKSFDLRGSLALHAQAAAAEQGASFQASLGSQDLAAKRGDNRLLEFGPIEAEMSGALIADKNHIDVHSFTFSSNYASLYASGSIEDFLGRTELELAGNFDPNWELIDTALREHVEPNARIVGRASGFWVRGALAPEHDTDGLEGEFGVDLQGLDVFGMRLGATPLVFHWHDGKPQIDPIETTLNDGRLHLEPVLVTGSDTQPWSLQFAPGSGVDNAQVNDEVSHRVLAFVAPVLDRATRVNGAVSARLDRVDIPLTPTFANDTVVEGNVLFHDVRFEPGPMAMQLYGVLGMEPMSLRLDQPVLLSIADGHVIQRGFSLPLGNVAHVLMDGIVGFDRSLALNVRVPMSGSTFASIPVFNRIAPALRLEFPVRGTLDDPKIDGKLMGQAMGRMGLDVAQAAGFGGIEEMVRQLSTPRDPEEEARIQAERAERQRIRRENQLRRREEQRLKREARRGAGSF